jgi:hypothetical protein
MPAAIASCVLRTTSWKSVVLRVALLCASSLSIPAGWYIAYRAWFETGSGFIYSVFFPNSALVFIWPALGLAAAWWLVVAKPALSPINVIGLLAALVVGLPTGVLLGLGFTCTHLNKCM